MTRGGPASHRYRPSPADAERLQAELLRFHDHLRKGGYAPRTAATKAGGAEWFVRFLNGEEFRKTDGRFRP